MVVVVVVVTTVVWVAGAKENCARVSLEGMVFEGWALALPLGGRILVIRPGVEAEVGLAEGSGRGTSSPVFIASYEVSRMV